MSRFRKVVIALLVSGLATTARTVVAQEGLTLARAVELAEKRAPEIADARARASALSSQTTVARAAYLPTFAVEGVAQGTGSRDAQPVSRDAIVRSVTYTGLTSATGSMRWTVVDLGKTSNNVAAAEAAANAGRATADEAVVQVIADAASGYVTLFYRDELRLVAEATVSQREKLVLLAKALVKSGLQPPVEEMRASARLAAARRDLATIEGSALDARVQLASLIGLPSSFVLAEPQLPELDGNVDAAARAAEQTRDAVKAARASVTAAQCTVDAANARRRPSLSFNLDGTYSVSENDVFRLRGTALSGVGAVVLDIPLFDASVGANVAVASAGAAAAQARLALALREAHTEAARAAASVTTSRAGADHAKKAADAAGVVFALVQARYAQGLASPIELIDAEASDADARSARAIAELTRALALVRLLVATGRTRMLKEGGPS